MAYGLITSRLESGHTLTGIGGSNPSLSASFPLPPGSRVNCGASAELREQSKRAKQRSVAELLEKVPPRKRTYLNGYRGFKSLPLRQTCPGQILFGNFTSLSLPCLQNVCRHLITIKVGLRCEVP